MGIVPDRLKHLFAPILSSSRAYPVVSPAAQQWKASSGQSMWVTTIDRRLRPTALDGEFKPFFPTTANGEAYMKSATILNSAQQDAISHIYETGQTYLVGQMGAGKTIIALTAISELIRDKHVQRALVFAPPNVVADVWPREHDSWEHVKHLRVRCATGTPVQRQRIIADRDQYDVMVLSYNNMAWFFDLYGAEHGFNMLVLDEVTKIKAGGAGFKKMRWCLNTFDVRVGMSGTPVSENFEQLFYPMYCVDLGASLGTRKSKFLAAYFSESYSGYDYTLTRGSDTRIAARIASCVVVLPDYTDTLPELVEYNKVVTLSRACIDYYSQLERDSLNSDVTADNAAVLINKLQQVASGFVYDDNGDTHQIHYDKLAEVRNYEHRPLIIVYQYAEELARLRKEFPRGWLYKSGDARLQDFRRGEASSQVMFLHPKSAAHGLDLTFAHHMIFMSPVWSRDLTRQTIARIWRRGQRATCYVTTLLADNTVDLGIVNRVKGKASFHEVLKQRLNTIQG